jgi:hypothetical protein
MTSTSSLVQRFQYRLQSIVHTCTACYILNSWANKYTHARHTDKKTWCNWQLVTLPLQPICVHLSLLVTHAPLPQVCTVHQYSSCSRCASKIYLHTSQPLATHTVIPTHWHDCCLSQEDFVCTLQALTLSPLCLYPQALTPLNRALLNL